LHRKSKHLDDEQLLSKINSLAAAINMTSPSESSAASPSDRKRVPSPEGDPSSSTNLASPTFEPKRKKKMKSKAFNVKSAENQKIVKEFREKHSELADLSDAEVFGIKTITDGLIDQRVNL
jgi:hypothetical protein